MAASIKMRKFLIRDFLEGVDAPRFNVAASIKMRKFEDGVASISERAGLQCGRIYKDAEIHFSYFGRND